MNHPEKTNNVGVDARYGWPDAVVIYRTNLLLITEHCLDCAGSVSVNIDDCDQSFGQPARTNLTS